MTHTRTILTILLAAMLPMPNASLAGQGDAASVSTRVRCAPGVCLEDLGGARKTSSGPPISGAGNGPLKPDVLRRQLADMAAHDARSVCVLPLPHEFRPRQHQQRDGRPTISRPVLPTREDRRRRSGPAGMNYWLYDRVVGRRASGGRVLRANRTLESVF